MFPFFIVFAVTDINYISTRTFMDGWSHCSGAKGCFLALETANTTEAAVQIKSRLWVKGLTFVSNWSLTQTLNLTWALYLVWALALNSYMLSVVCQVDDLWKSISNHSLIPFLTSWYLLKSEANASPDDLLLLSRSPITFVLLFLFYFTCMIDVLVLYLSMFHCVFFFFN